MDYLYQRNRCVAAQEGPPARAPEPGTEIVAAGKRVVVIGGGDTGMDCISNANREGAIERDDPRRLPGARPERARRAHAVAAAAQAHADDVRARGGRRALVGHRGHRLRGRRTAASAHVHARRVTGTSSRDLQPVPGSEFTRRRRPRADRDRLLASRARRAVDAARRSRSTRAATSARARPTATSAPRRLRLRRRAHRPVARRHRDRRGPQVRADRQQGPRRQPDGRRPRAAGDRRLERRSKTTRCATRPRRRAACVSATTSSAVPAGRSRTSCPQEIAATCTNLAQGILCALAPTTPRSADLRGILKLQGAMRPAPPESSPPRFPAAEGPDGFGPFRALRVTVGRMVTVPR